MKSKLDQKKVKAEALKLINSGQTKQTVYDELVEKYKSRFEIAQIVRYTASPDKLKQYGIWNTLFLGLIFLVTIYSIFEAPFVSIMLAFLLYIVAQKQFKYYYFNNLFGSTALASSFTILVHQDFQNGFGLSNYALLLIIPIALAFVLAGIYLPYYITPKYREQKLHYRDPEGNEKIKVVHIFEEVKKL